MSIQSSGKLINNYYSNYNFWSATFKFFGVNKTDGKSLLGLEYRPLDKI
jgi:hypothetical protein